ncbi:MAG: MFS transporter [Albidovulum sp.]
MMDVAVRKRIWGWFFFDWASQPYNTLLLTFIFAPYVKDLLGDGSKAQAAWGYGIGLAGLLIAILAPVLGAVADKAGGRMRFIWLFSAMYVVGSYLLWWTAPGSFNLTLTMLAFAIGLIGMEFATIFTNAMLPDLGTREEIGRISGAGWAFGYVGGLIALVLMLALFQIDKNTGKTLIGLPPMFGLDPATRDGTRIVGPLTSIWFAVFMIPFFLWVREPRDKAAMPIMAAVRSALPDLKVSLASLPSQKSLSAYLLSSMFYRDALNGIYTFGGIYAAGVLNWQITDTGKFGLLAIVTGAIFAWLGGRADDRYGPKPVIVLNVIVLTLVALAVVFVSRTSVFGVPVGPESSAPDIAFYALGALIGAAGGALQTASRTMMVRQAHPERITEAFGLYALAGKATSFIAPLSIGIVTDMTGSQQLGIVPLVVLFAIGLILMLRVNPNGGES